MQSQEIKKGRLRFSDDAFATRLCACVCVCVVLVSAYPDLPCCSQINV